MKYRGGGGSEGCHFFFRGIPRKFRYFVGKVRIRGKLLYVARTIKTKSTRRKLLAYGRIIKALTDTFSSLAVTFFFLTMIAF